MPALTVGVSFRGAPLELLERMAFADEDLSKAYRRLADADAVREAVILSTCNRVEVVAEVSSYHAGFLSLRRFLAESSELAPEDFAEPLYSHYEDDAAEHLFEVAAGLDSMVLGEPQILSQVRQAARRAEAERAAGPATAGLLRAAVRAGRRVRAETAVGASPGAFVHAGADLAARWLRGLGGRSALVVGAGQMAALAVAHLRERGVDRVRIVNRTPERAAGLAARAGAEAHGLDRLAHALAGADVVIACTGAVGLVIAREDVERSSAAGRNRARRRRMFFVDLAVPRDVDPGVATIPGVGLADIDDLRRALRGSAPAADLDRAHEIVREEVARLAASRRAARLAPLIQGLRDAGERAAAAELARLGPRLSGLSKAERETVEALARGVVAKLLHRPIVRLKERSGPAAGDASSVLADLFGFESSPEA